jgi:chaperonin cofactor prefoldin
VKNMSGETRPFKLLVAARAVAEQFQRESKMTKNEILQLSSKAKEFKNGGNKLIGSDVEAAVTEYNEGIQICPISDTETRVALFSNISECYSRLKTKFAEYPEKSSYYNKLIIKYATRTQAIQWQHGKTLWKRGKAFLDEKLWK